MANIRYHRVRYNETLEQLSCRYYGTPDFAMAIYKVNSHFLLQPNNLPLGHLLVIPYLHEHVSVG